jgi:hypothetical protein
MMNVLKRTGLFLTGVLLCACAGNLYAQQVLSLDGVITQAAKDVETRLSAEAKLAVLNFTSGPRHSATMLSRNFPARW